MLLALVVLTNTCTYDGRRERMSVRAPMQVWKDVDGMMTADPRAVPGAVPVPCVSYEEAAELAYFGANILHPVRVDQGKETRMKSKQRRLMYVCVYRVVS